VREFNPGVIEIIRGLLIKQTQFADLLAAYAALSFCVAAFVVASIARFRKTL
jgi:hypothetical protein